MTIPYTYLIRFKPTAVVYYGVRFAENCHPDELWKTYFTSSKIVRRLIEDFGKESFEYQIRKTFQSKQSARDWEQTVLRRINAENHDRFLNRSNNLKGILRNPGEYEWCYNPNLDEKILIKKGEVLSSEWNRGVRGPDAKQKGTIVAYDTVTLKHKRFHSLDEVPTNYVFGRTIGSTKGMIWIHNDVTNENKLVNPTEVIPIGWTTGPTFIQNKGRIKIHKNGEVRSVFSNRLSEFLDDGWEQGSPSSKNWSFFRFENGQITKTITTTTPEQYPIDTWISGRANLYQVIFSNGSELIAPWQIIEKIHGIPRCMILYSSSRKTANSGHSTKYGYTKITRVA